MNAQRIRLAAIALASLLSIGPALAESTTTTDRAEFNATFGIQAINVEPPATREGRQDGVQAQPEANLRPRRGVRVVLPSPYGR